MGTEYTRGYSKGYAAGLRRAWPEHAPPVPPDPMVAALVVAASGLRDETDALLAGLDSDDEWERRLAPHLAAVAAALRGVTAAATQTP